MKKLLYTLLAVSIIFSACEKEEDNIPETVSIIGYWNSFEWSIIQNEGYWTAYPNGQKVITNTQSEINNFWLDLIFYTNGDAAGVDEDGSVIGADWIKNGNTLLVDNYNFTISTLNSSYLTLELFESDTNTSFSNPINDTVYFTDRSELFKFERNTN
tara:strand:+ start:51 stop:521 length:471 start_codon:yes stop_codon:yes gene_type:complete